MTPEQYIDLKEFVIGEGYAHEVDWSESLVECNCDLNFFEEAGWVICNSGMKNQVAKIIWDRIIKSFVNQTPIEDAFGHKGKTDAILHIWKNRKTLLARYLAQKDNEYRLAELEKIPYIGKITKYHLAKNLGMDVCKPDRHLVRIAEKLETIPEKLCQKLSDATGDRIATVDYVIWRAANLGKI